MIQIIDTNKNIMKNDFNLKVSDRKIWLLIL